MTSEISSFIERQARAVSIREINRLIVDLPALRERFAKIPMETYPHLADQLQLLSLMVESQMSFGDVNGAYQGVAQIHAPGDDPSRRIAFDARMTR